MLINADADADADAVTPSSNLTVTAYHCPPYGNF